MQQASFDTQAALFDLDTPPRNDARKPEQKDARNDAPSPAPAIATAQTIGPRVDAIDWTRAAGELDAHGCAMLQGLLRADECDALGALYARDDLYRSRVVMARHGFGRGEYKYYGYPLPDVVGALRTAIYPRLALIANGWNRTLGIDVRYPPTHAAFLRRCREAGQLRPTPLILQYAAGDFNCLHQDLYGEHVFPIQLAILLSEPGKDFTGGEFVLTEQRPRMQSRVEVVPLRKGDAVLFAVHQRPVQGTRGAYRVNMRHGVSRLHAGHRQTLGIIFHDAT
ncbi:2OG-Fe(II) oxygenase [Paraburkholderia phymatum]|uniref:2OG-Fe(II) oxygenase n=1 Tax=Paraburkholderia phymatum TaxID=148447 RepID=A0ACC6UB75_9BURK